MSSTGPRVILGVGGGIAAYKTVELLRRLQEPAPGAACGLDVHVVPTAAALRFVGAPTWAAVAGHPITDEVWTEAHDVAHVRLGRTADLVVVAPATADLLAKFAHGLADDLLTNIVLTARCPVLLAPAMHTEMWHHPATTANVATLRDRGVIVVEPATGRLTGVDSGPGRLPEPDQLAQLARLLVHRPAALPYDLAGRHVVISAGGTREPVDPVRYLGNASSGQQGVALAAVAAARGARVTLVAANLDLVAPGNVQLVAAGTAAELQKAVLSAASDADLVIMAAAVADYRPAVPADYKIKKVSSPAPIELVENDDVLAELVRARTGGRPLLVGFAAETGDADGDVLAHGRAKLARKRCDLLVVNEVGPGVAFGQPVNAATILGLDGSQQDVPLGPKAGLAAAVLDLAVTRLPPVPAGPRRQRRAGDNPPGNPGSAR